MAFEVIDTIVSIYVGLVEGSCLKIGIGFNEKSIACIIGVKAIRIFVVDGLRISGVLVQGLRKTDVIKMRIVNVIFGIRRPAATCCGIGIGDFIIFIIKGVFLVGAIKICGVVCDVLNVPGFIIFRLDKILLQRRQTIKIIIAVKADNIKVQICFMVTVMVRFVVAIGDVRILGIITGITDIMNLSPVTVICFFVGIFINFII